MALLGPSLVPCSPVPQGLADKAHPDLLDLDGARPARAVSRMVPGGLRRGTDGAPLPPDREGDGDPGESRERVRALRRLHRSLSERARSDVPTAPGGPPVTRSPGPPAPAPPAGS